VAAIQHSIKVNVPITRLYIQLTQFEDYPRFLENVENVRQLGKTRLHWTTRTADGRFEWDAEVTEQEENSHIAWHNANDGNDACRIELNELGPNLSDIRFILETKPDHPSGITGGVNEEEIAQQLERDLATLKQFLERASVMAHAQANPDVDLDVNDLDTQTQADIMNQVRTASQRRTSASVSGSPTEVLEDEPNESGPGASGEMSGITEAHFPRKESQRPSR
jgi:hypothetical protein